MAQIFHPSTNTLSRLTIYGFLVFLGLLAWACIQIQRSPWNTGEGDAREQPIPFSHEHHVAGLGIDCRYCHTAVEYSSFAGIPPTKTCMNCHSEMWTGANLLEPVRDSFRSGRSIEWVRVNDLPDFVYFQHDIHINKGIGCSSCHGQVDRMPITYQAAPLTMEWCLDCHRAPEKYIRPRDQVFNVEYVYPSASQQRELGLRLIRENHVRTPQDITSCSTCHR